MRLSDLHLIVLVIILGGAALAVAGYDLHERHERRIDEGCRVPMNEDPACIGRS